MRPSLLPSSKYIYISATPRGMWDLSSPTRDQTHARCTGSVEFNPQTAREAPLANVFLPPQETPCPLGTAPTTPCQSRICFLSITNLFPVCGHSIAVESYVTFCVWLSPLSTFPRFIRVVACLSPSGLHG